MARFEGARNWQAVLLLVACGSSIDDGRRDPLTDSPSQRNSLAVAEATASASQDSTRVVAYLHGRGLTLEGIAAAAGAHYAAIVSTEASATKSLMLLLVTSDSITAIADAEKLGRFPPASAQWLKLAGRRVNAFVYTQNYDTEGLVRTTVMAERNGRFARVFRDAEETCWAAVLRDLDGDTVPELIEHVENPGGRFSACVDPCDVALFETFSLPFAWMRVRRWTGGEWESAEEQYPKFYAELQARYDSAAAWAQGTPSSMWGCGPDGAELLRNWAERARRLAAAGPP